MRDKYVSQNNFFLSRRSVSGMKSEAGKGRENLMPLIENGLSISWE